MARGGWKCSLAKPGSQASHSLCILLLPYQGSPPHTLIDVRFGRLIRTDDKDAAPQRLHVINLC